MDIKYKFNEIAANKLMSKIDLRIKNLAQFPKMHPVSSIENCRKCVVDNFVLFYKTDDAQKTVYVVDIFHGLQNYYRE